jgi:hypothetical protein
MHPLTPLLLHEILRERQTEADERALAARASATRPHRPSGLRRALAMPFVVVSRSSAAAVRRLDACLADDLADTLRAGHGA